MPTPNTEQSLPDYAPELAAYHRAYEKELRAVLAQLPLPRGGRVLDVACGDAVYGRWLKERDPAAQVVAMDLSRPWLQAAARQTGGDVALCQAVVGRLPFSDDTFDLVWCAQSLYSLPDVRETLREMTRVARPGGVVAVLEDDTLHQVILPWPPELELAVRSAEWGALAERTGHPDKFYIGRWAVRALREAGLVDVVKKAQVSTRQSPWDENTRRFVTEYLRSLQRRAGPFLPPQQQAALENLMDPASDRNLLDGRDLSITCLDFLVYGVKP